MSRIPIEISRSLAQRRMAQVFIEKYKEELDELVERVGEEPLPFPTPRAEEYYLTGPEGFREDVRNAELSMFIYVPDLDNQRNSLSGGGSTYQQTVSFHLKTQLFFQMTQFEPITDLGRELTLEEVMKRRALRYLGAMLLTGFKWARGRASIDNIEVSDSAAYDWEQQIDSGARRRWGTARVTWRISQKVTIPRAQVGAIDDSILHPEEE